MAVWVAAVGGPGTTLLGTNFMRRLTIHRIAALLVVVLTALSASVDAAAERAKIGRATGSLGSATIDGQKINIGAPVYEGSQVVTGPTDSASVLLDSKVVVKFDSNSSAVLTEVGGTHVRLVEGNVEIFVAKRKATQGPVALSDPDATIEALGTVVVAGYQPNVNTYVAALESARLNGVLLNPAAGGNSSNLPTGNQATFANGRLVGIALINPNDLKSHLGNIASLDAALNHQAGTRLRQQFAVNEAVHIVHTLNGQHVAITVGQGVANGTQSDTSSSTISLTTAQQLTAAGVITSTPVPPSGGSGGIGGSGPTGGPIVNLGSATVQLNAGNILQFLLFNPTVANGEQVSVRVLGNGASYLSVPVVTVSPTGTAFDPTVAPGTLTMAFTALNDGTIPPNSGAVTLQNTVQSGQATHSYVLNSGQTATLKVIAKAPGG